jgi:hypothetical protein
MGWLLHDGEVLASVEVATGLWSRIRPASRLSSSPAVVIDGGRFLLGLRSPSPMVAVDLNQELLVLSMRTLRHSGVHLYSRGTRWVVVAPLTLARRWSLSVGDELELRVRGGKDGSDFN